MKRGGVNCGSGIKTSMGNGESEHVNTIDQAENELGHALGVGRRGK